jgi:hypothetical protein
MASAGMSWNSWRKPLGPKNFYFIHARFATGAEVPPGVAGGIAAAACVDLVDLR